MIETDMSGDPTSNFTGLADTYASARPGYPAEAIAYILDALPSRPEVADVGCGTGISTRLLIEQGARVTFGNRTWQRFAKFRTAGGKNSGDIDVFNLCQPAKKGFDCRQGPGERPWAQPATAFMGHPRPHVGDFQRSERTQP